MTEPHSIEQLYFLAFDLILVGWVLWLANRKKFFVLPSPRTEIPLSFKQLFFAFGSYLLMALLLLPVLFIVVTMWITGLSFTEFSLTTKGYLQLLILFTLFLWSIAYTYLLKRRTRRFIYSNEQTRTFKQYVKSGIRGLIALAISYPIMVAVNIPISFITYFIFQQTSADQLAVQQLKNCLGYPVLFSAMLITVSIIVPFVEEVLFRGFLQSWLLRYLSRGWAIFLSSLIFTVAHFSKCQGVSNIELLCSLFVLSCFLGFIYERERTLVAPVVMHGTFNCLSALMIALTTTL